MTTQNQLDANRLNAQKSTGPRTPEGKARSAQNALKHGLLAQRTILVDEDEDQFDDIRRALFEDLAPDGPFEILLVERIVAQYWRLQRTLRMETALIEVLAKNQSQNPGLTRTLKHLRKNPDNVSIDENNDLVIGLAVADDLARETRLLKMQQYEARIENGFYKALRQFHEFRKSRPKSADAPTPAPERPDDCHSREGGNPDPVTTDTPAPNEPNPVCHAGLDPASSHPDLAPMLKEPNSEMANISKTSIRENPCLSVVAVLLNEPNLAENPNAVNPSCKSCYPIENNIPSILSKDIEDGYRF
jgi:uncharacterized protein YbaR (Trm112 family)